MSEGIGTAPSPEPPAPWTPPAHWPPMPAGLTEAQQADWILRLTHTDALKAQTAQLKAATDASRDHAAGFDAFTDAQFFLSLFSAMSSTPMTEAAIRARAQKLLPEFRKLVPAG